jgi:hypothetical protein
MSLPQPVRLYDQPRAPNPRRVNIFLAEKGIEIERVNVDLIAGEHKQPERASTSSRTTWRRSACLRCRRWSWTTGRF